MAVAVHFPDGSIRDVPGQLRQIASDAPVACPIFEQVPLNHDARWLFEKAGDRWIAAPRLGHVARLRPMVATWWAAIAEMNDLPTEHPPVDRSAA